MIKSCNLNKFSCHFYISDIYDSMVYGLLFMILWFIVLFSFWLSDSMS